MLPKFSFCLDFYIILGYSYLWENFVFCYKDGIMVNVAVDVMGGDNAPVEPVKGAINAIGSDNNIKVFLCGKKDVIEAELKKYQYNSDRVEIVDAPEVIEMGEAPVMAIRKRRVLFSSLVFRTFS